MLPPDYPDYADIDVALEAVREFVVKATDEQLERRLNETQAQDAEGRWYFLPYLVAYRALKSQPRWLNKGDGAEFRDLKEALAGLAEDHAAQVETLGLTVSAVLTLNAGSNSGSSSVPTVVSW